MKSALLFFAFLLLVIPRGAFGAIGCTLSNPAEDLKYLYPEMTTYKEELQEFPRMKNGAELFKGLRAKGIDVWVAWERKDSVLVGAMDENGEVMFTQEVTPRELAMKVREWWYSGLNP